MKTNLTPEQSQRLIELGVDPGKASMCQIQHSADEETEYRIVEHDEYCYEMSCLHPKPIFNMTDILLLLPRIIKYGNRVCRLKFQAIVSIHDGLSEVWQACYTHTSCKTNKEATELIDALYELLCWVLQNLTDKIKTSKR